MGKKKRTRSKRRKEKREALAPDTGQAEEVRENAPKPKRASRKNVLSEALSSSQTVKPIPNTLSKSERAESENPTQPPDADENAAPPAMTSPADLRPQSVTAELPIEHSAPISAEPATPIPVAEAIDSLLSEIGTEEPETAPETSPPPLARLWRRLAAFVYDVLLLVLFNSVLFLLAFYRSAERFMEPVAGVEKPFAPEDAKHYFVLAVSTGIVVSWLYITLLEALPPGATLGKQIFSIRTADINGKRISFARSNLRVLAKIPSILSFGFGCIVALFRSDRKALHDILAKTQVVKK